ncbi:hypothetical protein GW17_00018242 [Ensete ventricosum]|nr:hypothetical protein GW17_00018242 [Ensete ventricosum]
MVDSAESIQEPKPGEAISPEISSTPKRENPREVNPGSEESVLKSLGTPIPAWTDEMHNMYLSSMESSFVDQLYNDESRPNDVLGCPTIVTRNPTTNDLGLGSDCLFSCQTVPTTHTLTKMDNASQEEEANLAVKMGKKKIWILSLHSSEQPKFVHMYEEVVDGGSLDRSFLHVQIKTSHWW